MVSPVELENRVARIEDLPYKSSPVMQFNFSQSAALNLGQYPFTAGRATMTNGIKNLTDSTLMYIKNISFSSDISVLNYQSALKLLAGGTNIPTFNMFLQSDRQITVLRDPILLLNYFNDQEYRLVIEPKQLPNLLSAFFRGTLQQHAGIAGVGEINLNVTIYAQEITDDNFIAAVKKGYPISHNNKRVRRMM